MKACAIMVNGELTFSGVIELKRFMTAIKYLQSKLTEEEVWHLALYSKCGSYEEEDGMRK
jgi:hypothetical protein